MRPTRDELLLRHAKIVAERSTCSRLQVGAVLARDGRILVTGYNGAPAGMPHCVHTNPEPCVISVHAEANVIAYAARLGISALGADLVTTHSPCLPCSQLIINAGIVRVLYTWEYRVKEPIDLLRSAGVACDSVDAIR